MGRKGQQEKTRGHTQGWTEGKYKEGSDIYYLYKNNKKHEHEGKREQEREMEHERNTEDLRCGNMVFRKGGQCLFVSPRHEQLVPASQDSGETSPKCQRQALLESSKSQIQCRYKTHMWDCTETMKIYNIQPYIEATLGPTQDFQTTF